MADRQVQILSNLIKAVSNVAESGAAPSTSHGLNSEQSNTSVEEAIRRLFPSTASTSQTGNLTTENGPSSRTRENHNVNGNAVGENSDRNTGFNPSNVYIPSGKKRAKSFSSKASKKKSAKVSQTERKLLKDVILLPGPKVSTVPKGVAREDLFARGFTTTFELSPSMIEKDIREVLEQKFQDKLRNIPAPKFTFVRAVSNKIVVPDVSTAGSSSGESFDGRMLKHFSGQGPIYIRAVKDISSVFFRGQWAKHKDDNSDSDVSSESDDSLPAGLTAPGPHQRPMQPACPVMPNLSCNQPSTSNDTIAASNSSSQSNISSTCNNVVTCPTCCMSFPVGEIESHADTCAEEKFGSIDENHYNDLMNFFDVDLYEQHIDPMEPAIIDIDCGDEDNSCSTASDTQAPGNHKLKIKEAITKLNQLVPDERSRYHIRRKTIFDDYISARERCKWLKPENRMNVTFIGEPGIDSGGPKREFLTDALKHIEMRLFNGKGMLVPSTVALTSSHFKYAGELMALSVVQGGPCPNFLSEQLYDLLSKGLKGIKLSTDMIEDNEMRNVAEKIEQTQTNEDLTNVLMEDSTLSVLSLVGYRGVPSRETLSSKYSIVRAITVKAVIEPQLGPLSQLEEGLKMYGFLNEVKTSPDLFQPLFVANASYMFDVSPEEFLMDVMVTYSDKQREKHAEEDTFKHFCDVVEYLFHAGSDEVNLSLSDLQKFITGTFTIPPLGLGCPIEICFLHGCNEGCRCRPVVSTCSLRITIPVHINTFTLMKEMVISAIKEGRGFGNA